MLLVGGDVVEVRSTIMLSEMLSEMWSEMWSEIWFEMLKVSDKSLISRFEIS